MYGPFWTRARCGTAVSIYMFMCICIPACVHATHIHKELSTAFHRRGPCVVGSQAFYYAKAFNANIAAWNVLSVTSVSSAFDDSVPLAECIKRGMYGNWGATLKTAYPMWSSLCGPPTPSSATPTTATPRSCVCVCACVCLRARVIYACIPCWLIASAVWRVKHGGPEHGGAEQPRTKAFRLFCGLTMIETASGPLWFRKEASHRFGFT